jgi:hypothetical protein
MISPDDARLKGMGQESVAGEDQIAQMLAATPSRATALPARDAGFRRASPPGQAPPEGALSCASSRRRCSERWSGTRSATSSSGEWARERLELEATGPPKEGLEIGGPQLHVPQEGVIGSF